MSEVHEKPHALSATLGLEKVVDHGESGRAVLHYRARMDQCHSGGIVQGGFVTGWIDAAMAHLVMAKTDYQFSPLSLEIKVSFLKSASPGLIVAEAWIERMGKSTAFLEGCIRNEAGEVLAKASSTVKLVAMKRAG
ncbi:MAG: PaaI family thioesterase [Proteobacteria bacterium]|nr:PaaI family thioesterase [Pseudomonadota bacterium]